MPRALATRQQLLRMIFYAAAVADNHRNMQILLIYLLKMEILVVEIESNTKFAGFPNILTMSANNSRRWIWIIAVCCLISYHFYVCVFVNKLISSPL